MLGPKSTPNGMQRGNVTHGVLLDLKLFLFFLFFYFLFFYNVCYEGDPSYEGLQVLQTNFVYAQCTDALFKY